jgi:hypothetical protein
VADAGKQQEVQMIKRAFSGVLLSLTLLLMLPVQHASAAVRVGSSVSNWNRITCTEGRSALFRRGDYRIVQAIDCRGNVFVYRAQSRNLNRYQIALRQSDGRVNSSRRIRSSHSR